MNNGERNGDDFLGTLPGAEEMEMQSALPAEVVLSDEAHKTIGYINAIKDPDRKIAYAEMELHGGIQRDGSEWNGFTRGLDNLEEKKGQLERQLEEFSARQNYLRTIDKSALSKDESLRYDEECAAIEGDIEKANRQMRALNVDMRGMAEGEQYAKDFINKAELAVGGNIELALRNFSTLPEELQGAIRTEDQAVFNKYGVDSWSARLVALEINKREDEERLRERESLRAHKEKLARLPSVIGTDALAAYSRSEIEEVLQERGIPTTDIAKGLQMLLASAPAPVSRDEWPHLTRDNTGSRNGHNN